MIHKITNAFELREAIADLVAYTYPDEERDYRQGEEEARENHIFITINALSKWIQE